MNTSRTFLNHRSKIMKFLIFALLTFIFLNPASAKNKAVNVPEEVLAIDSVKTIVAKAESLIDTALEVHAYLCITPFATLDVFPLSYQSWDVIQDKPCDSLYVDPSSIPLKEAIKLFPDTTLTSLSEWRGTANILNRRKVKILGYLRKEILDGISGEREKVYYYYIEVISISSIPASGVKAIQRQIKKNGLNNIRMNRFFSSGYQNESLEIFDIRGKAVTVHFLSK